MAEAKPFAEVAARLRDGRRILVAGCGGCVAVCQAGGEHEAQTLAEGIRLWGGKQGRVLEAMATAVPRQCEPEWVDSLREAVAQADAVVSLGCGVGVGFPAEAFPQACVIPGLNTIFGGGTVSPGVFEERCAFCGDCVLADTAGICPVSRCAKRLANGLCGGSSDGRCEISSDLPCAWQMICERLAAFTPPKDWSRAENGGPRRIRREDLFV